MRIMDLVRGIMCIVMPRCLWAVFEALEMRQLWLTLLDLEIRLLI